MHYLSSVDLSFLVLTVYLSVCHSIAVVVSILGLFSLTNTVCFSSPTVLLKGTSFPLTTVFLSVHHLLSTSFTSPTLFQPLETACVLMCTLCIYASSKSLSILKGLLDSCVEAQVMPTDGFKG